MKGMEEFLWFSLNNLCTDIRVKNDMVADGIVDEDYNEEIIYRQHRNYNLTGGKETIKSLTERLKKEDLADVRNELIAEIKAIKEEV